MTTPTTAPKAPQQVRYLLKDGRRVDSLSTKAVGNPGCQQHKCLGSLMRPPLERPIGTIRPKEEVLEQAKDFINQYYESLNKAGSAEHNKRTSEVLTSIEKTGTYDHTADEINFGSKTAWRNASRCIGRIQWKNLRLFDGRKVKTPKEMFEFLKKHLDYANNGGNIRSCITVFPKRTDGKHDFRVWNSQLVSFAGYEQADGTILGDPAYVEFTNLCFKLGWKGPKTRTNFDVLPWVLQAYGENPECFDIPKDLLLLVDLKHPTFSWFEDMKLKWYAIPAVANMLFDIGGIEYPGSPFSGWYMGTEVGSRDMCDPNRYNILEKVAKSMGLDTKQNLSLWKDKALVEVNLAVLHSYRTAGVTMVDHHTASDQFMSHMDTEFRVRGGCPADWVWIVPPMSGSITPVFHQEMLHYKLRPSYEYQIEAWKIHKWGDEPERKTKLTLKMIARAILFSTSLMKKVLLRRPKCTILYATETGKSREYAKDMLRITSHAFNSKIYCMDEYDLNHISQENLVLVIASTFGNGDPPENGRELYSSLETKAKKKAVSGLNHVKFSVFALGSTAYPIFCAFGRNMDAQLEKLGAHRIQALADGDELQGQEEAFRTWASSTFRAACLAYHIDLNQIMASNKSLLGDDLRWSANKYRYVPKKKAPDLHNAYQSVYKRKIFTAKVKETKQLQASDSERQTVFVNLSQNGNTDLSYEPGDHVAVYPVNKPAMVNGILKHLLAEPTPDTLLQLQRQSNSESNQDNWFDDNHLPAVLSVRMALTYFLDITAPPSQHLLAQLAEVTKSKNDKNKLDKLAKDSEAYNQWRYNKMPTLQEVFLEFSSLKLPASFLLTQLPLLQPRFYSISSAPQLNPDEVHLTVAVVEYQTHAGKGSQRHGVCSNWLNNLSSGDNVFCFVRSAAKFHLPEDKKAPVIMVGPGTGIAPLRSFWQHQHVEKTKHKKAVSPMALYFGSRYSHKDNLYEDEKQRMIKDGILAEHHAVSREPGVPKVYVQDLLTNNGASVYKQLVKENGHIYVCGDVDMAADVHTTLVKVFQQHGKITITRAEELLNGMKSSNNYHEDIYGALKGPHAPNNTKQTKSALKTNKIIPANGIIHQQNLTNKGSHPNGTIVNGTTPNGIIHNGSVPNVALTNGTVHNGSVPNGMTPINKANGYSITSVHDYSDGDEEPKCSSIFKRRLKKKSKSVANGIHLVGVQTNR